MQSKKSFFNTTIFVRNNSQYAIITVIYSLIWFVSLPINIFMQASSKYFVEGNGYTLEEFKINEMQRVLSSAATPVLPFLFSIIVAMAVFSYLYNSRNSNMMHAFPLTRGQLYVTNILSGICILLIPVILNGAIAAGVVATIDPGSIGLVLKWIYFEVTYTVFFFGMAAFCAMFSGQLFAAGAFYFIWNLAYEGVKLIIEAVEESYGFGLTPVSYIYSDDESNPLFPLVELMCKTGGSQEYQNEGLTIYKFQGAGIALMYGLIGILFIVIGYMVYKRRSIERAGDFITVNWAKPLFKWGIAFAFGSLTTISVVSLLGIESEYAFFGLNFVLTFLYFYLAEMIIIKGVRIKSARAIIEGVLCACIFTGAFVVADANGYWKVDYIPDRDEISYVGISANYSVKLEGSDIDEFIKLHQEILDAKDELDVEENAGINSSYINLAYFLNDGTIVRRGYTIPIYEDKTAYSDIIYADIEKLVNKPEMVKAAKISESYESLKPYQASIDVPSTLSDDVYKSMDISQDELEELYQAIIKDMDAGAIKNISSLDSLIDAESEYADTLSMNLKSSVQIPSDNWFYGSEGYTTEVYIDVTITPECKNIISELEKLGFIDSENDLKTYNELEAQ